MFIFSLAGASGLICAHESNRLPLCLTSHRCRRPTGCIAGAILFFFLNLNPHQGMSLQQHMSQFDFIGLALLMSGVVCVLVGLNSGETNCASGLCDPVYWLTHTKGSSAQTIVLLAAGSILLIFAAINEISTTRSPIIPPRLFKVGVCRSRRTTIR